MATISGGSYGNATVAAGANGTLTAFGWGNVISGGSYNVNIAAGSGQETVHLGSGNDTVQLTGWGNALDGGDGSSTITGAFGNSTVNLGNGSSSIDMAGYSNFIGVGNGANTITAGYGNDTVTIGSGNNNLSLAGYSNVVTIQGGYAGHDTITAGSGGDSITLVNAVVTLAGGNAATVYLAGSVDTVTDNAVGTTFVDNGTAGAWLNINSDPTWTLDLTGGAGGFTTAAQVQAALVQTGAGAQLTVGGSVITLVGATASNISAAHFKIG